MVQQSNQSADNQTYQHRTNDIGHHLIALQLERIAQSNPLIKEQKEGHDETEHDVDRNNDPIRRPVLHRRDNGQHRTAEITLEDKQHIETHRDG